MYFQTHFCIFFPDVYEEFYTFALIMDPFRMSLLAPYVLNILR